MARSSSRTERSSRAARALLLSPVVILFASATRLIIISNYDTATATTIASSAGAISTLLGTVVPLLPLFLPALFIILIIFRRWASAFLTALAAGFVSPAYTDIINGLKQALATITDIWRRIDFWPRVDDITAVVGTIRRWLDDIATSIQSRQELLNVLNEWTWVFICAVAALLVVFFFDPPRVLRAPDFNPIQLADTKLSRWEVVLVWLLGWIWRWPIGRVLYGIAIVVVSAYSVLLVNVIYQIPFDGGIISDTLRRPWLPAEEVRVTGRSDPLVGYVLSTSDGWHVLLNNDSRQIIYLRSVDVTARTVCHIKQLGEFHEPLIKLEGAEPAPISTCGQ